MKETLTGTVSSTPASRTPAERTPSARRAEDRPSASVPEDFSATHLSGPSKGFFMDAAVSSISNKHCFRCNDNPCGQDPCGANADCENRGGRAICKCRPNYEGDPFVNCVLNPCLTSPCGINADCQRNGDRAICNCRDGYSGDPFVRYYHCTLV